MKTGIMNNPSKSVYDEAVFCGKAGFDFLDLTIEGPEATNVDVAQLKPILESSGLFVIGHTDPCLPYAYPVQGVRNACLDELERCAKIFATLGAKVMNIHPCYFCPPAMRKDLVLFNIEALQPVVEMAASYGLTLVLENYKAPFDRVSTFKKMLTKVPGLKLHLDFGHLNFGNDNYDVFCRELGEEILHVHFSDNRARADDHMPLGVGNVNWQKAVESLKATGYDGTITLEIFCNDANMQHKYLDLSRDLIQELWKVV
ncbi:Xylose isomerase domain-containing protein TIM barrel [Desulfamplus magnetovallimortis]|uniref:Xylose isomerase domain-containing protein TIM barrel n=1 Tax=Desulfamplus magnetovallimortis TaxID=1246637 RepID=A0A1W1HAC7_9BACT|nr:sugar phosphate isomerase/epimerase [Desulfamplus magnetovallimortis]SLM29396.1 Xylose isomerase domain-containing protein TIM barrel [Desulfamplus magnetovallimortis]